MLENYVEEIVERVNRCEDLALLDLILRILTKAE